VGQIAAADEETPRTPPSFFLASASDFRLDRQLGSFGIPAPAAVNPQSPIASFPPARIGLVFS